MDHQSRCLVSRRCVLMRPSQKDDKAQMLLATGVVLMMSLLSMAIFSIKLAGMSVPHDVASDAVIQSSQDVESVLPGLVEARAEVWYENGVSALESVTQAMDSSHEDLLHHGEINQRLNHRLRFESDSNRCRTRCFRQRCNVDETDSIHNRTVITPCAHSKQD